MTSGVSLTAHKRRPNERRTSFGAQKRQK